MLNPTCHLTHKSTLIKYHVFEMQLFNTANVKKLPLVSPEGDKYQVLRVFLERDKVNSKNLSNVVKPQVIPTYLKLRYGDLIISPNSSKMARGSGASSPERTRQKLHTQKIETPADLITEEVRDLLSKLSESNKDKIFEEFMKKEIPDQCGQALIDYIYLFAVNLNYLVHLFVEIIFLFKEKNHHLFTMLLNHVLKTAQEPLGNLDPKVMRLRVGNLILLSEIYVSKHNQLFEIITPVQITQILKQLMLQISPITTDVLKMVCDFLKKILPIHLKNDTTETFHLIQQLEPIMQDPNYDRRAQFMIQDVLELYDQLVEEQ